MSQYLSFGSVAPSQSTDAYIFQLVQTVGNGLAAITSADELVVVDRQNLSPSQTILFENVPIGANCLVSGDVSGQSLICSGTDGQVVIWDVRSRTKASHFRLGSLGLGNAGPSLETDG